MVRIALRSETVSRIALVALCVLIFSSARAADVPTSFADAKPFLGRWDLTLHAPDREYASWLDIGMRDSRLTIRMVGRWGHARELPSAEIRNDQLRFVSPKEEEGRAKDMVFEGRLSGQALVGTTSGPDGASWTWRGERAPELKRSHAPQWAQPVRLFNGRDLSGWHVSAAHARASWRAENGVLVSAGHGPELITDEVFDDFKLHIEFNVASGANSGIYLRGRYEVQIENDAQPEGPSQRLGGVYGFLAPSPPPPRVAGRWQTYDITLVGRRVTVVLNGRTIIDHQDIPGITGGALDSHEAQPGPIYLQGSEAGQVSFRNIVLTPAKTG
jgi:3-keto-disaccharide hydrolase